MPASTGTPATTPWWPDTRSSGVQSGALQWTHSLTVGNVDTATVHLSKDDVQFGVRAVGKDGKKSPAVFPLPVACCIATFGRYTYYTRKKNC
jgi:hypothetical protein